MAERPTAATLKASVENPTNEDELKDDETPAPEDEPTDAGEDKPNDEGDEVDYETDFGCTKEQYDEAVAQGYDPEYDGPNKRSVAEFLERGSFFRKINDQKTTIKKQGKTIEFLMERAKAAEEEGYKRAKAELKAQRREAMAENDPEALEAIEERMGELDEAHKKATEDFPEIDAEDEDETTEYPPEAKAFLARNSWYDRDSDDFDPEMESIADGLGRRYMRQQQAAGKKPTLKQVFDHVEKGMNALYKKDEPAPKKRQSRVEGGNRRAPTKRGRTGSKYTADDLSSTEREIMDHMMAQGKVKSDEEYIQGLVDAGYNFDK